MFMKSFILLDINTSNVMLFPDMAGKKSVGEFLPGHPAEKYGEVQLADGQRRLAWVSQPVPHALKPGLKPHRAELLNSLLIDFGNGE